MKSFLLFLLLVISASALEIELTSGDTIRGDLILQTKGKFFVKSESAVISIFKKSIQRVDSTQVKGKKEFTLPDSLILKNKNELIIQNTTGYAIHVKLRDKTSRQIIGEKELENSQEVLFTIPDGEFYTTTKYMRPDSLYYKSEKGITFLSKPDKFEKQIIELRDNKNYPLMTKAEREFNQ